MYVNHFMVLMAIFSIFMRLIEILAPMVTVHPWAQDANQASTPIALPCRSHWQKVPEPDVRFNQLRKRIE